MSSIIDLIGQMKEREVIREKIAPLNASLYKVQTEIKSIINNLDYSNMELIKQSLYDNFTEEEKDKLKKYRDEITEMNLYAIAKSPFDPFVDAFDIYDYEENEDGQIRISVSCKKNDGSISGLMTFLDVHKTAWINKEDLLKIKD